MVDIYTFEVDSIEFEKIISGKKTVQLVVNDTKHRDYAEGNQITFKRNLETLDEEQSKLHEKQKLVIEIKATVSQLLYFESFVEAISTLGKENCGFKSSATIEKTSDLFLSSETYESIEKNGIVAIVFETQEK